MKNYAGAQPEKCFWKVTNLEEDIKQKLTSNPGLYSAVTIPDGYMKTRNTGQGLKCLHTCTLQPLRPMPAVPR